MKKFTAILLTVLMIASLFISCENKITPVSDETVSVSFDESTSRSLTASLDLFKANDYYWAYKAVKRDNTGLISGKTNFAWIDNVNKGLTKKVAGFSQGIWEFTLYAYTEEGKSNTSYSETGLAYTGTNSSVTLIKGADNKVLVRVNPISTGNGYLIVDTSNISMKLHQEGTLTEDQLAKFEKKVKVTNLLGTEEKYPVDGIYTLPAGAYKVTVRFENKENSLEYASGSVVATVYANMTTTVQGTLDEILTNADFETEINPDVMNRNVSSDAFNTSSDNDITINKKGDAVDEKVSATVPKTVAQKILSNAIITNSIDQDNTTNEMTLSLTVDTTSTGVTEDGKLTIAYEIGMSSILTSTNNTTSEVTQYSSPVTGTLADFVVAEVKLQSGLASVSVTHNFNAMEKLSNATATPSEDNQNGAYYYDSASGLLTIKTKSFSPFEVTYKAVSYIAEMNGVKYSTIQDAINDAPTNALDDTVTAITLLSNVCDGASFGFPDLMANKGKNICIDLNGNTYTFKDPAMGSSGTESQAMHLAYGNKLSLKNGTINVSSNSQKILMLIMNYCDLTLEDVMVDCSNVKHSYNNSICRGSLTLKGNTNLIASSNTAKIFDVDGKYGSDVSVVFDETYSGATSGVIDYVASTGNHTSNLSIKSGTFTGMITSSGSTKPSITGGTFSFDPSEYVADGYETKEENGKWIVSERISLWDGTATENWDINEDGKYHITSATDLKAFADMVNNGTNFKDKTVVLETGINLNEFKWTPIGQNSIAGYPTNTFSGIFDGGNHTIKDFIVNASGEWASAGLFGSANRATIKNVVIDNATINSTHYAGGILGFETEKTTISDCVVKNSKIISVAENSTGKWDNGDKVGGIVGYMNEADIKNCYVNSTTLQGYRDIGGIIGYAGGGSVSGSSIDNVIIKVDNLHNYKNYEGIANHDANHIVGESHGTIVNCTGAATINFLDNM